MNTLRRVLNDSRGMTLAEILVALGIVFTGLIALAAVAPLATGQIGGAQLQTTATFLVQQQIERIRNSQWTTTSDLLCAGNAACNDGAGQVSPQWPDEGYATIAISGADYSRFRRTVRISTCSVVACGGMAADPSLSTLRQVTVTVFFFPITGSGQSSDTETSVGFTSLIAQRP